MNKKFGFFGMGNMAQAILMGFISSGKISATDVYAFAPDLKKLSANAERLHFNMCSSDKEVAEKSDIIILACKPYQIEDVLGETKDALSGKALVSIAAGWNFEKYNAIIPDTRIQTVMPNTPLSVGEGVVLFEDKHSVTEDELSLLTDLFNECGITETVPGDLMGIAGTITGCGPAFIDLIIEALGDAGVKYGLKRDQAYRLASAMIKGSAALQLSTGTHPGVLKDAVCSPAGTTIRGVEALEASGLRTAFINAVNSVMMK